MGFALLPHASHRVASLALHLHLHLQQIFPSWQHSRTHQYAPRPAAAPALALSFVPIPLGPRVRLAPAVTSRRLIVTVDTLAITCSTDFTQRLTAPSTDTPKTIDFELSSVPLAGSWRARVTRSDADCALSVSTDAATFGYKPLALDLTVRLDASLDDGDVLPIAHGDSARRYPPAALGSSSATTGCASSKRRRQGATWSTPIGLTNSASSSTSTRASRSSTRRLSFVACQVRHPRL